MRHGDPGTTLGNYAHVVGEDDFAPVGEGWRGGVFGVGSWGGAKCGDRRSGGDSGNYAVAERISAQSSQGSQRWGSFLVNTPPPCIWIEAAGCVGECRCEGFAISRTPHAAGGARVPSGIHRGGALGPPPQSRTTEQSPDFHRTYQAGYRGSDYLWSGCFFYFPGSLYRPRGAGPSKSVISFLTERFCRSTRMPSIILCIPAVPCPFYWCSDATDNSYGTSRAEHRAVCAWEFLQVAVKLILSEMYSYFSPNNLSAFSLRMSGRTSSRMEIFSKSASQRSGVSKG